MKVTDHGHGERSGSGVRGRRDENREEEREWGGRAAAAAAAIERDVGKETESE